MRTTTCTLQVQQSNGPTPSTEHYKLMVALCTHLSRWHNLCQSWVYHNLETCMIMRTYYTRVHLRHFPSLHEWKGNSDWDWVWCNLRQKRYCDNVDCFSFYTAAALFSALEQTHCICMWFYTTTCFFNTHRSGVLTALAWLVSHETAAVSAQVPYTPYNHAPCDFMQSHIRKVYVCLAVTCHLHFWQNDQDLLRATAVTQGWNGYRNNSQHRKLTLEKKILLPLLLGFEATTSQSWVQCSNHWAIPTQMCEGGAGGWC